jgi:hypothetical protein
MDASTFVAGNSGGIYRSTNAGSSWSQVSTVKAHGHTTIQFNGKFYLGTAGGLLASTDKGATWHIQGAALNIYQGPFFGADENTMVVAGTGGVYKTTNAGTTWTKISALYPNSQFDLGWMGCYSWDPINNIVYACRMTFPAYKYQLPATAVSVRARRTDPVNKLTIVNSCIRSTMPVNLVEIFSLAGRSVYRRAMQPAGTLAALQGAKMSELKEVYRVTSSQGETFQTVR